MAHADTISEDVLKAVAAKIGREVLRVFTFAEPTNVKFELSETFLLYQLKTWEIRAGQCDVERLLLSTHRWHHQIRVNGEAQGFARTLEGGPNASDWTVREVYASPIAGKIDTAVKWVDAHLSGDPIVRLLIAPEYQLHAFWLHEGPQDGFLVADKPRSYLKLEYGKVYSPREFLATLAGEQPATGILPPSGQDKPPERRR
jgi:hypothetical protein